VHSRPVAWATADASIELTGGHAGSCRGNLVVSYSVKPVGGTTGRRALRLDRSLDETVRTDAQYAHEMLAAKTDQLQDSQTDVQKEQTATANLRRQLDDEKVMHAAFVKNYRMWSADKVRIAVDHAIPVPRAVWSATAYERRLRAGAAIWHAR
jgi:hypothetical protein